MTLIPPAFQAAPTIGEPWLGYIRVSTWKEEKISPELQETAIRQWAARTGRRLLEPFIVDLDESGRHFKRRIMGAIERVERGEARGIAVWRYSRFGRNRTGNAVNLARLEAVGGQLESATEPVDARTAVGELQREMIFAFGNFESNRAGEQWKETHEFRRAMKLPATGRPRFGYLWHPRRIPDATAPGGWRLQEERYELHQQYAEVAEEMYDRKLNRAGFASLAHWLNDELRIPTTRGNRWAPNTVQRYLDSGFAAGLLRVHDPECPCKLGQDHFSDCKNGRMIYIAGAQPAILTPDEWENYEHHRQQVKNTPPRARSATYANTGITACGNCRGTGIARSATKDGRQIRGHTFVCSNHKNKGKSACEQGLYVLREDIEKELLTFLEREVAEGVDNAPPTPGHTEKKPDPKARITEERARLAAELAKIDGALDRLVSDYALNPENYPADSYARVRDQFTKKKGSILTSLQSLKVVEDTPDRAEFRPLMVGMIAEWETFTPEEKNAMLRQVVRRIACTASKADEVGFLLDVAYEVHPVWEPDPWVCRKCGKVIPGPGPLACPQESCKRA
ncbi:recombinase family protein [Streptomyces sp. YGL11-2]|uniref:recombinase family protein n=1 Tax=Streptomyces sp. YGL11-2 TaxID=3414028 RepID=UPI003CE90DD9